MRSKQRTYSQKPKHLGLFEIQVDEFFSYNYLPIKLSGQNRLTIEKRLEVFNPIIGRACCDFIGDFGLDNFVDNYIYITAKSQYQRGGHGFNREGWHSDGYGSKDISYIWSNRQPTIFNNSFFNLRKDDKLSMEDMAAQALPENDYFFPENSLLRLDQYSIHRVGSFVEGPRAFAKICFSPDIYALKGNSVNYDLKTDWFYRPREKERNIPQS